MNQKNDNWKDKIRAGVLADRLHKHALGKLEMTVSQIQAAKILLAKVAPDLKAIEAKIEDKRIQRVEVIMIENDQSPIELTAKTANGSQITSH